MTHDEATDLATFFFESQSCSVLRIPEGREKTADLRVQTSDNWTQYVEIKCKSHDRDLWGDIEERVAIEEVVNWSESHGRSDAIGNVLKGASRQLSSTAINASDFRMVWMAFDGHDCDLRWEQVIASFYGMAHVHALWPSHSSFDKCIYYDYSISHSKRDLDALIICDGMNLAFCMNEFSPRYGALKTTQLYRDLEEKGGLWDPQVKVAEREILALHSDVTRGDEQKVINALREQTGIEFMRINLNRHSAATIVRFESDSRQSG